MNAGHDHHGHGPQGHGAPADYGRAFALGTLLNLGFVIVEVGYGIAAGSMALVADGGHNLSDVLGLGVAWAAWRLGRRSPSQRFTYGLRSSSILAALFNALLLVAACGVIAFEAVTRLIDPAPVAGGTVTLVAAVGIGVNLGTAMLFARGRKTDINLRGAYLHMAADAAVSAGVAVAGLLTLWTGSGWIDPATSLIIVAAILASTWGLLRESLAMAMQAVPDHIDPVAVADALAALPGVAHVHHIHIWPISTTQTALTAHLVMPGGTPGDAFLGSVADDLEHRFGIAHSTLQVETGDGGDCALTPSHAHHHQAGAEPAI